MGSWRLVVFLVGAVAWLAWRFWPAPDLAPKRIAVDAVTLADGRTLLGRYLRAERVVELVDDRGRPGARVAVAGAVTVGRGEVRVPLRGGPGIDGTWITDWELAKALAADDHVPILADFTGSDWCPWCMRLDEEVFDEPAFRAWARGRVVLLRLDFPSDESLPEALAAQNDDLERRFGVTGYPTVHVIDPVAETSLRRWGYVEGGFTAWVTGLTTDVPGLEALAP